ncbi:hypothetical protein TKK_0001796 [Trichogramma kaykai]|uniref:Uncharacterized protein n=1 Tax=Trichogramma kaykai TaxID=54128 RepID=A0ABD2XFW8_9HYME
MEEVVQTAATNEQVHQTQTQQQVPFHPTPEYFAINPEKLTITKLMKAVKNNNYDAIQKSLAAYGMPKNGTKTTDYLILQTAINRKHKEVANLLLQYNCNVNDCLESAQHIQTPLYLAVDQHDYELVDSLLMRGALIDMKSQRTGRTPMHEAAIKKQYKSLYRMLDFPGKVNILDDENQTVLQILLEQHAFQNVGNVPLHPLLIKKLLSKGALINIRGCNGLSLLHIAALLKRKDVLLTLLTSVQAQGLINALDNQNNSILHALLSTNGIYADNAEEEENLSAFISILQLGAYFDVTNKRGQQPIHLAAKNKHFKIFELSLKYTQDVNVVDVDGKSILHYFLENVPQFSPERLADYKSLLKTVISKGAIVDAISNTGDVPLHMAVKYHDFEVFLILLSGNGNINALDHNKNTVLHFLMERSDCTVDVIGLLINRGICINAVNKNGETALDIAAKQKRMELFNLLKQFDPSNQMNALNLINGEVTEEATYGKRPLSPSINNQDPLSKKVKSSENS